MNVLERAVTHPGCEHAAERLIEQAGVVLAAERSELSSRMSEHVAAAEHELSGEGAQAIAAVERLLCLHELPDSEVGVDLDLPTRKQGVKGRVLLLTQLGLEAVMTLSIPKDHRFNRPVRVGDVQAGLAIELSLPSGLRRRARARRLRLDRYFVTRVELAPEHETILLRRRADPSSTGFDLSIRSGEEYAVEVRAVAKGGRLSSSPPQVLRSKDAEQVERFVRSLRESAMLLRTHRAKLEQATLAGADLGADSALELAGRLVGYVAPFASEISKHGSRRGELSLKRDLGGGRREELYLDKRELAERIGKLPSAIRATFDALELFAPPAPQAPAGSRKGPPPLRVVG
jgi:hypothetical protein